jgi:hypothetical protein
VVSSTNVTRFALRIDGGAPVEHELPLDEQPGRTWKAIPLAAAVTTLRVTILETHGADNCASLSFSHATPAYAGRDDAFAALQPAIAMFHRAITTCNAAAFATLATFPLSRYRSAASLAAPCKRTETDVFGDSRHVGDCVIAAVPDQVRCAGYSPKAHTTWTLAWRAGAWKLVEIREHRGLDVDHFFLKRCSGPAGV